MTLVLEPIVDGNPSGETIVFVQGWPDDASLWDEAVAALAATYRCIRVNMPGYGGTAMPAQGYETAELVEALAALIRQAAQPRPVTLVLHDWGSYWGHAAHARCMDCVSRVATLDVAPHFRPSPIGIAGIALYQLWLFGAFELGGLLGDAMSRGFAKLVHAPASAERINARINYPYRNIWADLASGRAATLTKGYWPSCPLLFVYGERKPFAFHSGAWLEHVRKTGGEVVGLPCGHWVMRDPAFLGILTRWLEATRAGAAAHAN